MNIFSDEQLRDLLDPDKTIQAIRAAFARGFSRVRMPVRTSLELDGAMLLIMPCYDNFLGAAGVKRISVSQKAGVNAFYELLDAATGIALARMEANYLTELRTAAASAVATDLLARIDAETLGIFGSGRQAAAHFAIVPRVRRFKRFLVCGSRRSDLDSFCRRMKANHGMDIEKVNPEICARIRRDLHLHNGNRAAVRWPLAKTRITSEPGRGFSTAHAGSR